jgi:hypothetical protein
MQETARTKVCFKCKVEQPIECFYRHPRMTDGHLGKCKACAKNDVHTNRELRIGYYREFDRLRGNRQSNEYKRQYRLEHQEEYKARELLGNAVRDKRVAKAAACEVCGASGVRLHGHHADYSKPLEVLWCCVPCHHAQHPKRGGQQ